jgi:hypothetical protein
MNWAIFSQTHLVTLVAMSASTILKNVNFEFFDPILLHYWPRLASPSQALIDSKVQTYVGYIGTR